VSIWGLRFGDIPGQKAADEEESIASLTRNVLSTYRRELVVVNFAFLNCSCGAIGADGENGKCLEKGAMRRNSLRLGRWLSHVQSWGE